jgi:hypothetical protein
MESVLATLLFYLTGVKRGIMRRRHVKRVSLWQRVDIFNYLYT